MEIVAKGAFVLPKNDNQDLPDDVSPPEGRPGVTTLYQ
jgi:hypothetical protein